MAPSSTLKELQQTLTHTFFHTSSTQSKVRALPDVAGRASYNVTAKPSRCSIHAAPQPAMPPPTTATVPRDNSDVDCGKGYAPLE